MLDDSQSLPPSNFGVLGIETFEFDSSSYADAPEQYKSFWYWNDFSPSTRWRELPVPSRYCGTGSDSKLFIDIPPKEDTASALSSNEIIAYIRSSLSLQVKELAEILRVQRPTIYSWIKEESEPSTTNRQRLQQIFRLATSWNHNCYLPADRFIRAPNEDGYSVLDMLREEHLDEDKILTKFRHLASERLKLKTQNDEKRPTSDAIVSRYGLRSDSVSDQQNLIDITTGKRTSID